MESLLLTIDYHDPLMLGIAFIAGFAFNRIGLPPLVGFLAAGFVFGAMGSFLFLLDMAIGVHDDPC